MVRALDGVDLAVAPGELVLVLGATGSGKSTLLLLASGLLPLTSGEASVDGVPLDAKAARGVIGLVFQNPESQLFAESVWTDVMFGPRNLGVMPEAAHDAARAALQDVGLDPDEFGPRSPFSLSGGEARRVALAGVLAMRPRYLLLDEPTAGLDARGRAALRGAVEHAREQAGLVVVSHDAEEFLGMADRVLMLADGSTAWHGAARDAVADPETFRAAGLVAPDLLQLQASLRSMGRATAFTLDARTLMTSIAQERGWRE